MAAAVTRFHHQCDIITAAIAEADASGDIVRRRMLQVPDIDAATGDDDDDEVPPPFDQENPLGKCPSAAVPAYTRAVLAARSLGVAVCVIVAIVLFGTIEAGHISPIREECFLRIRRPQRRARRGSTSTPSHMDLESSLGTRNEALLEAGNVFTIRVVLQQAGKDCSSLHFESVNGHTFAFLHVRSILLFNQLAQHFAGDNTSNTTRISFDMRVRLL
jgi:hypothetical protein